jgi:hypothetical protein
VAPIIYIPFLLQIQYEQKRLARDYYYYYIIIIIIIIKQNPYCGVPLGKLLVALLTKEIPLSTECECSL